MASARAQATANLTNGIAAGALFTSTFFLAKLPLWWVMVIPATIAAIAAYSVLRPPVRAIRGISIFILAALLGYLASLLSGYQPVVVSFHDKGLIYLAIPLAMVLFVGYHPEIFSRRKMPFQLRAILVLKNTAIAFCWTTFTCVPWALIDAANDQGLPFIFAARFLFVFALSMLSDIADSDDDRGSIHTIVNLVGNKLHYAIILVLAATSEVLFGLQNGAFGIHFFPVLLLTFLINREKKWRNEWFIDLTIVAHSALLIAFS